MKEHPQGVSSDPSPINTHKPPSCFLIWSVSHSRRWDSVALIVCGLVCRLWLKSDNQTVGHSCWPTFLPQLHRVYHQGLLAGSGLAPGPDSDPPPLLLPRFKWRRVGQYSHLCVTILTCICGVQFSQHRQTFLIFHGKLIHRVMHSNDLFGESVIP